MIKVPYTKNKESLFAVRLAPRMNEFSVEDFFVNKAKKARSELSDKELDLLDADARSGS